MGPASLVGPGWTCVSGVGAWPNGDRRPTDRGPQGMMIVPATLCMVTVLSSVGSRSMSHGSRSGRMRGAFEWGMREDESGDDHRLMRNGWRGRTDAAL